MRIFVVVFILNTVAPLIFSNTLPKGRTPLTNMAISKVMGSSPQRLQMFTVPHLGELVHINKYGNEEIKTEMQKTQCLYWQTVCFGYCPKYPLEFCPTHLERFYECLDKCRSKWNCEIEENALKKEWERKANEIALQSISNDI